MLQHLKTLELTGVGDRYRPNRCAKHDLSDNELIHCVCRCSNNSASDREKLAKKEDIKSIKDIRKTTSNTECDSSTN